MGLFCGAQFWRPLSLDRAGAIDAAPEHGPIEVIWTMMGKALLKGIAESISIDPVVARQVDRPPIDSLPINLGRPIELEFFDEDGVRLVGGVETDLGDQPLVIVIECCFAGWDQIRQVLCR